MKTLVMQNITMSIAVLWMSGAMAADSPTPDQDRVQTREEVQTVFAALDRNSDERISRNEAAREKTLRDRFAAVDSSGDGFLSRAEFLARPNDQPFE